MATIDPKLFSELMNSLQTAVLLVARLEPDSRQSVHDAGEVRAAVERAAHAAQRLRPGSNDQV